MKINVTTIDKMTAVASACVTAIAALFDKVPTLLLLLIVAMVLDYLTGYIKAAYFLKEWNSKAGLEGLIKKLMYFVIVATAFLTGYAISTLGNQIGVDLGFAIYMGFYTTAVLLINELTSILENLYVIMPDKTPIWLVKVLKIADNQLDNKINDLICKKQDCEICNLKSRCTHYLEKKEDSQNGN